MHVPLPLNCACAVDAHDKGLVSVRVPGSKEFGLSKPCTAFEATSDKHTAIAIAVAIAIVISFVNVLVRCGCNLCIVLTVVVIA